MYAVANALNGMSRAEAARLAGVKRQTPRDAIVRYNADGLDGLHDRPRSGRKPRLTEAERTTLAKLITDGPHVEARVCRRGRWPIYALKSPSAGPRRCIPTACRGWSKG